MISYHNFLFPFRFDKLLDEINDEHAFYKKYPLDKRVRESIEDFEKNLQRDGWIYKKFKRETELEYNEFVYFYDFVKDSLFNLQEFKDAINGATSYFFEKELQKNAKYIIKLKKQEEPYELDLKSITLRIFDTGVGILSFEAQNHIYTSLEDILNINEFGRRTYPQFLPLQNVKDTFLADSIEVNGIKDSFEKKYIDAFVADFISENLGNTFTTNTKEKGKLFIQPILDDRMFVLCWYGNDGFSNALKSIDIQNFNSTSKEDRFWYDNWYKFVFVDTGDKTIQNDFMQQGFIKRSTYARWQNYGTLYGITRYSFMCLTDREYFGKEIVAKHIQTIYFQMVTLLLTQRASIIRFSDEITAISDIDQEKQNQKKEEKLSQKISNLYKNYLRFKNKLYFKEITAQEQGIELYDKARKVMRIDNDINDLSNEMASLSSYAFFLEEKEEKEQMNKLTKLGTIFLPGTFIAGVFGMNIFPIKDNIVTFVISSGFIIGLTYFLSKRHNIDIKEFFIKEKNE